KKYVLKNLEDFINARRTLRTISYGAALTYDSDVHSFSQEDENIISFIEEYIDLAQMASGGYGSYGYYNQREIKFLKNKSLVLSQSAFKRFLKCVGNKKIYYKCRNEEKLLNIKNEDMPLELALKEKNGELILKQSKESLPFSLTSSNEVFVCNDTIYIPSKNQLKSYMPFYNILKKNKEIIFKKDYADDVFNKVLPVMNNIAEMVKVDKEIEKMVEKSELIVHFYLDRNKDNIWCKLKLNYGDISFDYMEGYKGERYVIRDLQKEKNIEKSLKEFKFYRTNDKFIFEGNDHELFEFLKEGIYNLDNYGEVYYSDKFKEQKVYNSSSISASIGGEGGFLDFSFSIGEVDPKEFKNILKAFKENKKFYKLNDNSFFDFEDVKAKNFFSMLDILNDDKNLKGNKLKVAKNKSIYLNNKIEDGGLDFINGKSIVNDIASKIATVSKVDYKVPKNLNATLREYQEIGFNWLKTLSHYGFGGVLADEMGLGATCC
ncbi:MAG: SNF2 helicase associated domain-containing protein, partial [Sarcina sp.]